VASTWRISLCAASSDLALMVAKHLRSLDFQVEEHQDISTSASKIFNNKPDLLLLISKSDDFNSFIQLITKVRSINASIPIFHLPSKQHFSYRVQSLQAGADDAMSPPYALEELDARVNCLLRRTASKKLKNEEIVHHADFMVNTKSREVKRAKYTTKLTIKEYKLLMLLIERHGRAVPREALIKEVWGQTWSGNDNLLEVYIRYLRIKIEHPGHEKLLTTVRGVGYMIR